MIVKFNLFNEYKLSSENYNNYYYLVLKFDDKTFESLCDGKFENLKGISDNHNIINSFFDVRDILLILDKKNTDKLNTLTKVNYDDIEYLTKDNFKVFRRLTNDDNEYSISSMLYQGFRKHNYYKYSKGILIGDYLKKILKKISTEDYIKVFKYMDEKHYNIFNNIKKVKNFDDLINQTYQSLDKLEYKYKPLIVKNILEYIILSYALLFKKEGEILVDGEIFHIPEKSTLLIKKSLPDSYSSDEHNTILDKYMNKLKEKYNIKELDYKYNIDKSTIFSPSYKSAFPIIRYLDKIKF